MVAGVLVAHATLAHAATQVQVVTHQFAAPGEVWHYADDMPSATTPTYSVNSEGTRAALRESLAMAQQIINGSCEASRNLLLGRVAPLRFEAMTGTKSAVLMSTRSVFVLINGTAHNPNTPSVWSPLWLERHKASERHDAAALAELEALSDYDASITINTNSYLAFGSSNCSWITANQHGDYYSSTSVFLHELVHAMGLYSLIPTSAQHSDPVLWGLPSIYDALITDSHGSPLLSSPHTLDTLTLESIAGQDLWIGGQKLYNPAVYTPGVSVSHVALPGSLMYPSIGSSSCQFALGVAEVGVLNALQWQCAPTDQAHTWDRPNAFFSDYSEVLDDNDGDGVHHNEWHTHNSSQDGTVALLVFVTFCLFGAVVCMLCVNKPTHLDYRPAHPATSVNEVAWAPVVMGFGIE